MKLGSVCRANRAQSNGSTVRYPVSSTSSLLALHVHLKKILFVDIIAKGRPHVCLLIERAPSEESAHERRTSTVSAATRSGAACDSPTIVSSDPGLVQPCLRIRGWLVWSVQQQQPACRWSSTQRVRWYAFPQSALIW